MKRLAAILTVLIMSVMVANSSWAQPPGDSPRGPAQRQDRPFNPLLQFFDADADGSLSEDEISAAGAKLKELDTSKDGSLSRRELRRSLASGDQPRAGGRGSSGPSRPVARTSSDLEKETLAQDDAEKRILATLEEMFQGERFRNVSPSDGRLLRLLAESMGAKRVVEIGTSTGESAVWLALALDSTGGKLVTHELDPDRAEIARRNFVKAGVEDIVTVIEGDAHETVQQHKEPIDILFLDADKQGYIDYLNKLLPLVRPGGLVIAHNMNQRQADPRFLKAITENPALETMILLKEGTGVGVTLKKRYAKYLSLLGAVPLAVGIPLYLLSRRLSKQHDL
jgi:caffeoyl-CoA O-methyltransferase